MFDKKRTYEDKDVGRHDRVWVGQPGSGLEKRQCTLQLCLSPEDNHVKAEIIFRGTGKRISPHEKAAYHKDVAIFWQKNAWADTEVSVEWVKSTLKEGVEAARDGNTEFVLLCDNLNAQTSDEFKEAVRQINGIVWYGPPGATDIWQPIDSGYGALMKRLISQQQDEWLECDNNMDKWIGNEKMSVSARRILISNWVGEANKKLQGVDYESFRKGCFLRTGCLITADGSEDDKIKPEGLSGFDVVPPLIRNGPDDEIDDTPEPAEDPDDVIEPENLLMPDESEEEEEDLGLMEVYDSSLDRSYKDSLVGRKIRVNCEDGLHVGRIDYYNTKIHEYRVVFEDSMEDMFVKSSDMDGINIDLI